MTSARPPVRPSRIHIMHTLTKAGLFLLACTISASAAAEPHSYNFSPVNQYNLKVSASFWNPIIRYVSSRSGVRLNLKLGRTSADTTSYVLAREVDFAFTNHLFSPEREKMGWTVFGRRDAAAVRAQIVVPAGSPVKDLAGLAGATIAFPGPEALVAYKVPYAELLRRNVPVNFVFAGNQDAAFTQLFAGKAKAAGANSQLVQNYSGREGKAFTVLWSSPPFDDLALMASPRVPPDDVRAVAQAFLGMRQDLEGRRILDAAAELVHSPGPLGFVAASDADYASYRAFYAGAPASLR
jgi:phosphonate transport system substrate-binding protein